MLEVTSLRLRPRAAGAAGGFTLIELLVTLSIIVVAMTIAVPSMVTFQRNAELTSATNSLTAAINAARGEAMKRNLNAFVIPVDGTLWTSGFLVFVDRDRTQSYGSATDLLVMTQSPLPAYLTVVGTGTASGSTPYVMFNGTGYTTNKAAAGLVNLAITISRTDVATGSATYEQTRNVMIAQTGRVRVCKPTAVTAVSGADCATDSP